MPLTIKLSFDLSWDHLIVLLQFGLHTTVHVRLYSKWADGLQKVQLSLRNAINALSLFIW